jgi:asparagine synthase (glutamine-hydrolysing)
MATGVEVRVPFLDEDLIAFAATIPDHFKQRFGVGKWILKKAMEPYLPKNILYRPKTGFGAPLRSWIRGPLRTYVDDVLSTERLTRRNIFDVSAVRKLIADNQQGREDAAYTIFSILCIEIWCSHFIDAPTQPCHNLASNTRDIYPNFIKPQFGVGPCGD